MTGTIANPSNPSVKFTEFAEPIIIKIPIKKYKIPKSIIKSLKKGKDILWLKFKGKLF